MGTPGVELLLAAWEDLKAASSRSKVDVANFVGYALAGLTVVTLLAPSLAMSACCIFFVAAAWAFWCARRAREIADQAVCDATKIAASMLAECDDVRAVGPLVDALDRSDSEVLPHVRQALLRLLPRVRERDAGLLGDAQRATMRRALLWDWSDLFFVTLEALVRIEDTAAIPTVRLLARGQEGLPSRHERAREAARDALAGLECVLERRRHRNLLARAARPPEDPSRELVRPAAPREAAGRARLVRPTEAAGGDRAA